MSLPPYCSECGAEISAGRQNGLCTRCLLALGLANAEAEPRDQKAEIRDLKSEDRRQGIEANNQADANDPLLINRHAPHVTTFGDYQLLEEIARGGMGIVYKARQVSLDRIVAVKLLLAGALSSPEHLKRFQVEASAAASLQHPNIVAIHEVGVHQDQHYLVMDFVEGPSLARVISDFGFRISDFRRCAQWMKTIAEAVHFAHEHGILHRDLKPSNILIDSKDQPRVTDFGLAKRFEGDAEVTLSGQVVGSPSYMPPEQAAAKRGKVSRRSDVYGLGAMLFHLLTGRPPFQAATLTDTLDQVLNTEPVAPRLLNPAVPRDLETICLKCLDKEPAKRYPTARMLAEDLDRFLSGQPVLARPIGPAGKAWRWCRRQPVRAGLLASLLVVLALGSAGVLWQWRQARNHAVAAMEQHRRADEQARAAEAAELRARQNAYAADMNLAQRALEESDLGQARDLLNRYRPRAKFEVRSSKFEVDLRGWEWRYLWARCRSDERFRLCQYSNAVSALAFSADGQWLAVRRQGGTVALWDAVARRPVAELAGVGLPRALAFSPRTNLLAWGNQDARGAYVSLWDLITQKEIARFPHRHHILSIAFSPDGQQMAALAFEGTVRVWNLESRQILPDLPTAKDTSFPGQYSIVTNAETEPTYSDAGDNFGRVLFSPDGHWLAVGEAKPQIRLLERATGKETTLPLRAPAKGITALAFSPDSKRLAAGCGYDDHRVYVWDLATRTNLPLAGHSGWITDLAFSPDGKWLAAASADQTLCLWEVDRPTQPRRFQGNTDEVWAVDWSPNGQDLVTGAADGSVRYWDVATQPPPPYVVLPPIWFWGPAFLPDSQTFLAVTHSEHSEGSVIRLKARWDTASVTVVEPLPFLGTNHTSLALSSDGHWLTLGDWMGNIQVWDFPARRQVTNLVIPDARVFALIFSPRGHLLDCGAIPSNGRLTGKVWEVATWREISLQEPDFNEASDVDFHPDERTMAIGFRDGTAGWWDIRTGQRQTTIPSLDARFVRVRFSPDGSLFATASQNGLLTVWDAATQKPKFIPRRLGRALADLAFSSDGRRLMASRSSPRGVVGLWDTATGRELVTLPGEPGFYSHLGCSRDGNTFFGATASITPSRGPALLWQAPSWEEIESAENKKEGP